MHEIMESKKGLFMMIPLAWILIIVSTIFISEVQSPLQYTNEPSFMSYALRSLTNSNSPATIATLESTPGRTFCPNRTPRTFPHFSYPPVTPVKWTDVTAVTNHTFTSFEIVNPREFYRICDVVELRIQARNGRNESKQYGGDYFRAKIYTTIKNNFSASSSSDGEVVDYRNGTYGAFFTLKFAGKVAISVVLIHASEAVYVLNRIRDQHQPRQVFLGTFASKKKPSQTAYCNYQLRKSMNDTSDYCNLTDANTGDPWYCERPLNCSCNELQSYRFDGKQSNTEANLLVNKIELAAIISSDRPIRGTVDALTVFGNTSSFYETIDTMDVCKIGQHIQKPELAGVYLQGKWYPPSCKIKRFPNISQVMDCFQNKQIYILGDSTIRQLFEYYTRMLGLNKHVHTGGVQKNAYTGPLFVINRPNNLSILFAFHGMPVSRNSPTYASDLKYIERRIDGVANNTAPVVIVSLWAHFTSVAPWFFERRIKRIVAASERLLKRNPAARVIFKGANTREHSGYGGFACCSDWYARDVEARIRRIVFQHERIGFLDAWDMTNAQLNKDNVHPTGQHVPNLSDQILTLLGCQS